MLLHASAAARAGEAVLLLGPSGAGKSDLVLRLIHQGWLLVADDQVLLTAEAGALRANPPAALHGRLEVRGLGILRDLPVAASAGVRLAVHLVGREAVPRLPEPTRFEAEGVAVPALALDPFAASAVAKLGMALDVVCGRASLQAGAFR